MKSGVIGFAAGAVSALAGAQSFRFDDLPVGAAPGGWTCGVTGSGSPRWTVERDPSGAAGNVLLQSGSGTFPWCVKTRLSVTSGSVEVNFLPISGKQDQAGGVVWRWKNGDHYYVARANALENNVSLYYTEGGRRNTIKYVGAPVARDKWHTLRVDFEGELIRVSLDGKGYIELRDNHIGGAGAVGVWTKADSVTAFSELRVEAKP